MAKTRPDKKKAKRRDKSVLNGVATSPSQKPSRSKPQESPTTLLAQSTDLLQTSRPDEALRLAERALGLLRSAARPPPSPPTPAAPLSPSDPSISLLPALNLIAEIQLELGDIDAAREHFLLAAELDPDGAVPEDAGGGAEKFLWLAQLSEEGGRESVGWFERGVAALRRDIAQLEQDSAPIRTHSSDVAAEEQLVEKKRRLANALCGVAEVYMTDLSWESDAEQRCETLVTEAVLLTPDSAEALQTLASVRISQTRLEEARGALARSLALWTELEPDDTRIPDFPSRVSLVRLLLETEMQEEAIRVVERLILEDDQSVEAWYLGGWGFYLLGGKLKGGGAGQKEVNGEGVGMEEEWKVLWDASREWLLNALKLFGLLDYEDDRLKEHAVELVGELDGALGARKEDEDGEGSDEGDGEQVWEDEDEDEDEDYEGSNHEKMQVS